MPIPRPQTLQPEESLGYQVRRCHRRFDRLLNAVLAREGLKAGYWYYLRVLWLEDGLTQKQLSDRTNVAENTTAVMINGMVADGLVERRQQLGDRRKQNIVLTERGRELETRLMHHATSINDLASADIPADEVAICLSVLARVSRNLAAELRLRTEAVACDD